MLSYATKDGKTRAHRVMYDRNGDPYRVFRAAHVHRGKYDGAALREIRARYGVGRPVALLPWKSAPPPAALLDRIKESLAVGMSQRKAALDLGISLGKLQRTLKAA